MEVVQKALIDGMIDIAKIIITIELTGGILLIAKLVIVNAINRARFRNM